MSHFQILLFSDFFNDKMNCIRPSTSKTGECDDYVPSVCWIQGLYVYKDVYGDINDYHAYGMPRDPTKDGLTPTGHHLCEVSYYMTAVIFIFSPRPSKLLISITKRYPDF